MIRSLIAAVSLVATGGVRAAGDCPLPTEVHGVLDQFLSARQHYAYSGTMLLEQNTHRQFITASSEPGESVSLRRMNTAQPTGAERFPLPADVSGADACDIGVAYMVSLQAGAVVAGHPTWRVTVRPRDNLRYGYVMDLDRDSGLPLRVLTATPDGQPVERYEFATIDIRPVSAAVESADQPLADTTFAIGQLPAGFQVVTRGPAANHLLVTDGLATASVFLEPLPDDLQSGEGTLLHGSTVTYTRGIREAELAWLVTVIGEVPVNTARLLAAAVRVPQPPAPVR